MKNTRLLFLVLVSSFLLIKTANAQEISDYQKQYQYNIKPYSSTIKIDGVLDEAVWTNAEVAQNFIKKYPNDIGSPIRKTEARMTYDKDNLYFAFKVYDSGTHIISGLKRDGGHDGNDCVGVILDPLNKKTNGAH